MSAIVYRIETLASGQPRAYANTVHVGELSVTREGVLTNGEVLPWWVDRTEAEKLFRLLFRGWDNEGEGDWASPRLVSLVPVGEALAHAPERNTRWRITIRSAYLD